MFNTKLSFTYEMWNSCVSKDKITKSVPKMKKIIKDDIKHQLIWGSGKNDAVFALPLTVAIPFFSQLSVTDDMKVKIDFAENCKFSCEELSYIHETESEAAEIHADGDITVTIEWKQ